jgi:hypothetical protein
MNGSPQPPVQGKKQYSKPTLTVHGDIQTLTAVVSNTSTHFDGGFGAMNRTH